MDRPNDQLGVASGNVALDKPASARNRCARRLGCRALTASRHRAVLPCSPRRPA